VRRSSRTLTVIVNGRQPTVFSHLQFGLRRLIVPLHLNGSKQTLTIELKPSFSFVPKNEHINTDPRTLSVVLTSIKAEALSPSCGDCLPKGPPPPVVVAPTRPMHWPKPMWSEIDDTPRILAAWMSTLAIEPGIWLDGLITTSTNVASVEVRTAAFSINTTRVRAGEFSFHTRILELPPLSRFHSYALQIIARNPGGDEDVDRAVLEIK